MKKLLIYLLLLFVAAPCVGQQLQWERGYPFLYRDTQILNMQPDPGGGYIVLFGEKHYGVQDLVLAQLDEQGDTLWTSSVPAPAINEFLADLQVVPGGYIIPVIKDLAVPNDTMKMLVLRYRRDGSLHWSRSYLYPAMAGAKGRSIAVAGANEYLVLGQTGDKAKTIAQGGGDRYYVCNLDSLGNVRWQKWYMFNYCLDDLQFAQTILSYRPGGYLLYGMGNCNTYSSPYFIKINGNGDTIQTASPFPGTFNDSYDGQFGNIIQARNGDFIITSLYKTPNPSLPNSRHYVSRIDTALNVKWTTIYPPKYHTFGKVIELADSTILLVNSHESSNQMSLIYFSPNGQIIDSVFITTAMGIRLTVNELIADTDTSILVAGTVQDTTATLGIGFRAYLARIVNITDSSRVTSVPATLTKSTATLGDCYPNPAASEAQVSYTVPASAGAANLVLHELVTGRQLYKQSLSNGSGTTRLDLNNLASGVYVYSLVVDGVRIESKKLVVVKQ